MILEFIGADHEVTGSCHYVECGDTRLIVDYGMEQGINYFKNVPLPVSAKELDYILITHAHIDHTGLLPLLVKEGFYGTIVCTDATKELTEIMLKDSANIQESEAAQKNKNLKDTTKSFSPRYTIKDAEETVKALFGVKYNEMIELSENVSVRFVDAGHLLGSSSIEMFLNEDGISKKLVFSGDIGNTNKPIIRDPQYIDYADYVVTEATYGDLVHGARIDFPTTLADVIQKTFDKGGNVVIPAFAVGRTQEILYCMAKIKSEGLVKNHDGFEVWVDSPMATKATTIYSNNLLDCYDDETKALVSKGINPISFDGLRLAVTVEESKAINNLDYSKVIISSSGMCDAGRIRHHLLRNLDRAESSIVIAGYQAEGTLGSKIVKGDSAVYILGEEVGVKADIVIIPGISAHADKDGLLKWLSAFDLSKLSKVFIVHSEDKTERIYADTLTKELGLTPLLPYSGSIYDLKNDKWIYEADAIPLKLTKEDIINFDVYTREAM